MNDPTHDPTHILTAPEVATRLRISPQRAYELARLGLLPCIRIGRQVRFNEASLETWIADGGQGYDHEPKKAA